MIPRNASGNIFAKNIQHRTINTLIGYRSMQFFFLYKGLSLADIKNRKSFCQYPWIYLGSGKDLAVCTSCQVEGIAIALKRGLYLALGIEA